MSSNSLKNVLIEIDVESDVAKVTQKTNTGLTRIKSIPAGLLPKLVTDCTINASADKDTGMMPTALVRHKIANGQSRKFYRYNSIECSMRFELMHDNIKLIEGNPYGFTIESDHRRPVLVVPMVIKDVGMLIVNTNTDSFSPGAYHIGMITLNMINEVDQDSRLVRVFPNHFERRICWNRGFNQELLASKDSTIQSKVPNYYLNSISNNDLSTDWYFDYEVIDSNLTKIKEFLDATFSDGLDDISDGALRGLLTNPSYNSSYYWISYVVMFYLTNIVGLRFTDICVISTYDEEEDEEDYYAQTSPNIMEFFS